jgi:hypothetical protein
MPLPTPTPATASKFFFTGKNVVVFLKPEPTPTPTFVGATPLPTPTPAIVSGGFSVTSYSANNDWRTYFLSPYQGFSSCSGCGVGSTEVVRVQGIILEYESSFNVTVAGVGTPTYQWQVRSDNGSFWSGWQNAPEGLEFKDVATSSLKWRYLGGGYGPADRKIALRCVINDSFVTKPIYYRYYVVPGDGGNNPAPTPGPTSPPAPTPPPTYGLPMFRL